jgi:hypothetical protein
VEILLVPSHTVKRIDGKPDCLDPHSLSRLEKAEELWEGHHYDLIVISGGTVSSSQIQTKPLATTMAEWATLHMRYILNQLIVEDKSRDTFENISLSLHLLLNEKIVLRNLHLTVVTEKEQGRRILAILEKGYPNTFQTITIETPSLQVPWPRKITEWLMYIYTCCDPRGEGWIARSLRALRTWQASH